MYEVDDRDRVRELGGLPQSSIGAPIPLLLADEFRTIRSPVSFGVLIAGYAVGSLLAIISITPSGLGPVEGIMILTYSDLGVMPEAATLVTLVYRGLSFWLPFVTGFAALRRLG